MEEKLRKICGGSINITRMTKVGDGWIVVVKDISLVDSVQLETDPDISSYSVIRNKLKVNIECKKEVNNMSEKYTNTALQIVAEVGGPENVVSLTHCITRLRFSVKDKKKVNLDALKSIKGALGAQWSGEQLQVIIGADVNEVYGAILNNFSINGSGEVPVDEDGKKTKEKFSINTIFEILSSCIVPVIPAMCGSGIIKGILIALTTYNVITTESGLYLILNVIGDATFYYLPFLVAYGAAKKFKTSTILSMVVAGIYIHPAIIALAKSDISVLGLPVHILNYSSTVFPVILSIWLMSYIYSFFEKHIPKSVRIVFAPTFTLFIIALLSLGVVGPFGYYIGYYLAQAINWLFGVFPALAGFILGAIRPVVILTGMQTVFSPLIANNIAVMGFDVISPVHTAASMAAAGVCLGAYLKSRDKDDKSSYFSFFISAFIGITEPALYGLVFRFRSMLIALMLGGGISGALTAILGVKKYASGMPSWITFPAFGDTIPQLFICVGVALVSTTILACMFGFKDNKASKERTAK